MPEASGPAEATELPDDFAGGQVGPELLHAAITTTTRARAPNRAYALRHEPIGTSLTRLERA